MKLLSAVILVTVLAAAAVVGLAYSGIPEVSATTDEPAALRWLLRTIRQQSVERRAAAITVPDLSGDATVTAGARAFDEICASCHGAPGREPFVGARDMSPAPPRLADRGAERSPAELFWIIKHGIRMTGMPAWGPTHGNDELWELVAFIRRLPALDAAGYEQLVARAGDDGHAHAHGGALAADDEGESTDGEPAEHVHDNHDH
ncbi:MAG: cytochrome c [Gammaproteobacteria bacterium]|nr:cytochrome c [Gammaproteobacteria bacterium]